MPTSIESCSDSSLERFYDLCRKWDDSTNTQESNITFFTSLLSENDDVVRWAEEAYVLSFPGMEFTLDALTARIQAISGEYGDSPDGEELGHFQWHVLRFTILSEIGRRKRRT